MTPEELRARGCTSKRRYSSRKRARHDAHLLFGHTGEHVRPYLCEYCGGWHNGHNRALQNLAARGGADPTPS